MEKDAGDDDNECSETGKRCRNWIIVNVVCFVIVGIVLWIFKDKLGTGDGGSSGGGYNGGVGRVGGTKSWSSWSSTGSKGGKGGGRGRKLYKLEIGNDTKDNDLGSENITMINSTINKTAMNRNNNSFDNGYNMNHADNETNLNILHVTVNSTNNNFSGKEENETEIIKFQISDIINKSRSDNSSNKNVQDKNSISRMLHSTNDNVTSDLRNYVNDNEPHKKNISLKAKN